MRTKTLLLTAAFAAVGITVASAQSVYSVNAVGYINVTMAPGYNLVANQLNGTNNVVSTIIPTAPNGTRILKWDPAIVDFQAWGYIEGAGWLDEATGEAVTGTIAPGEGFFVQNNGTAPFTMTFVGEVPQGTALTVNITPNYNLISSIVPMTPSVMPPEFPAVEGMRILKWSSAAGDYLTYGFIGGAWLDESTGDVANPAPAVGEGFFVQHNGTDTKQWTRSFTVN